MKLSHLAVAALLTAVAAPAAAASLANPGFETGDTTGWTTGGSGAVDVLTTATDASTLTTFNPTEGQFLAHLTAGPNDDYTTLSQGFTLTAASKVSFDAAFLAFDETSDGEGFDDDGYVRIFDATTNLMVFQADVNLVGDFGNTGWVHAVQGLDAGVYTIEAGVRNVGDDPATFEPGFDSQLLLDNIQVSVPEPETWALMILGFAGLGAALRARRRNSLQRA
jgi:hypothetical protein